MEGKKLRIVFMGTPDFAVTSLARLVEEGYNVIGVITAPDRPAGRGKRITESAVKKYAIANDLKVLQPIKFKDERFLNDLKALRADLQIVVAFRMLPKVVWNMPPLGTFNLHGSLLPNYRGAAPLNWAIINDEKTTGVTTFLLDEEIDTGRILLQKSVDIKKDDTVGDLHDNLMEIGAELVTQTVDLLANRNYQAIEQEKLIKENIIKPAPKIFKDDCKIDWSCSSEDIRNLIRGLSPYPAAWSQITSVDETKIKPLVFKIFNSKYTDKMNNSKPGTIYSDNQTSIHVVCGDGKLLELTEVQMAGKKRMSVQDFLRGFKEIDSYRFES